MPKTEKEAITCVLPYERDTTTMVYWSLLSNSKLKDEPFNITNIFPSLIRRIEHMISTLLLHNISILIFNFFFKRASYQDNSSINVKQDM